MIQLDKRKYDILTEKDIEKHILFLRDKDLMKCKYKGEESDKVYKEILEKERQENLKLTEEQRKILRLKQIVIEVEFYLDNIPKEVIDKNKYILETKEFYFKKWPFLKDVEKIKKIKSL